MHAFIHAGKMTRESNTRQEMLDGNREWGEYATIVFVAVVSIP